MKTIIFTGGGTAGHVSPNLALIPYFLERGFQVHYIGSKDGIEKSLIKYPVVFHEISTGKLRRYFSWQNFIDPFKILRGYFQSRRILRQTQPNVIFSKGGFVSVPVCFAAAAKKVPVILHESDFTPGLANRLCLKKARVVCTSFQKTLRYIPDHKGVLTGVPIRRELRGGNVHFAKTVLKFDQSKPTVLVMGGSLGARAINECVFACAPELTKKYNLIHIVGQGNLNPGLERLPGYRQFAFVTNELADFYAYCDFVVCRSGATTIFELLSLAKPMLLIPLPKGGSRGDQLLNADYFQEVGFAKVLPQEQLTPQSLTQQMDWLNENKQQLQSAMAHSRLPDSNKLILDIIDQNMK